MIDCHCHISADEFNDDRGTVLQDGFSAGVSAIVAVAESYGDFAGVLSLSNCDYGRDVPRIAPCLGVHPVQRDANGEERSACMADLEHVLSDIRKHSERLVGIGEVGLDFQPRIAPSKVEKDSQRDVLKAQVELAEELDLPLNVHSRSAGRPTVDFLKECGARKVLLHAFDGRAAIARAGVEAGFYFSIPPSIVRSEQKQKLVSVIPLGQLLLETDSPALGPEKQARNVPSNLHVSAEEIAKIKDVSVDEVITVTTQNALRLFPKIKSLLRP